MRCVSMSVAKVWTCVGVLAALWWAPVAVAQTQTGETAQTQTEADFATWLDGVREEARSRGIGEATVAQTLVRVAPIERVLELDRKQPEFSLSFDAYLARTVSPQRIARGRQLMAAHRTLLAKISQHYGVPSRFIVAMWGIESDFGRVGGSFPVIDSLATLAYDGRRSQYFRGELMNALLMVDSEKASLPQMQGSWAGAMGQCQFMPSTYVKYAVDWSGDGKADIWSDPADVFASTANYLSAIGWKEHETWGRAVLLPKHGIAPILLGLDKTRSLREWERLGLREADGRPLPKSSIQASLIRADGGKNGAQGSGPAFLVYDNFRVFMKWNRSIFFALAAGTLADRFASK